MEIVYSQTDMDINKGIYRIDSTDFAFKTIGIIGIINENEEFCWAMDIYAESNSFQEINVSPMFSFTQLGQSKDYVYNKSFRWEKISAYDDILNDWIASFYIYDSHYFIANVEIERIEKKNFHIVIDGKVNLNWETAPTTDFKDFKIEKTIPFNGILLEINDKQKVFEIAKRFIDIEGLKWLPKEETSSGENNWLTH
jgi:hypothetical protein